MVKAKTNRATKKYRITKDSNDVKGGMVFEWDKEKCCYITKELPWMLTPLIDKWEMEERVRLGQFEEI